MSDEIATDVVTHMCPPIGSHLMPCCGIPIGERLGDRVTLDLELVSCWFRHDLAAAEADLKAGRVKTLEQLQTAHCSKTHCRN